MLLAGSRSEALLLTQKPSLESIPGLIRDYNDFVRRQEPQTYDFASYFQGGFEMAKYRDHILSVLGCRSRMFSDIEALCEDSRRDTIWRFVTLVFMQHDREVELIQYGNDLLVERVHDEAYG